MTISSHRQRPGTRQRPEGRPFLPVVVTSVLLLGVLGVGQASAQELYNFTASVRGVIGGPLDVDGEDPGFDQTGVQLGISWLTLPKTHVTVRAGIMDMGGEQLGSLFDPELTWISIGGEYTYQESYYTSGLFLSLGLYSLDGNFVDGMSDDDSSLGVSFGVTGDFPLSRRWSIVGELSAHYADLDYAQLFGTLQGGVAFKF